MWKIFEMSHLAITERNQALLNLANYSLAICTIIFSMTVLICYPFAHFLSLPAQLVGHIFLIISAVGVKLTYLLRCVAQKELHMEVG